MKNGPRYNSKMVHVGGEGGGQKCPKIGPHGLSMTPHKFGSMFVLIKISKGSINALKIVDNDDTQN